MREVMVVERGREASTRRVADAGNTDDAKVVRVTMSMTRAQKRALKQYALDHEATASGIVQGWIERYCVGEDDG